MLLFFDKEKPSKQKKKAKIVSLKEERSQIMHLMLSGQSGRDVDEDVFSHENSKFPPSLTRNEEMYTVLHVNPRLSIVLKRTSILIVKKDQLVMLLY